MTRVIELNDAGVMLADDGQVLATSPGYALFEEQGVVLGEAARAAARMQPLRVNHLFWSELSNRPLPRAAAGVRSHADLAFLHLRELLGARAPSADVLLLVPAEMGLEQLGLLKAIAQAVGFGRPRIIDTAVAAARAVPGAGKVVHADVELHRATLSELRVGENIERGRALTVPGAGQHGFHQRWLETIARDLVFATRFDPLQQGASEQALFDAIPGLNREAVANGRVTLTLGPPDNRHSIDITRDQLIAAAAPLIDEIVTQLHRLRFAGEASRIALGARAAVLPGLKERLAELPDTEVFVLQPATPIAAVSGRFAPSAIDEAHRATTLPSLAESDRAALGAMAVAAGDGAAVEAPSHMLYRGQALALEGDSLTIGTAVTGANRSLNVTGSTAGVSRAHCTVIRQGRDFMVFDHSSYGTWLNDERIAHRARLKAGDRLRLGSPGIVLEFIAVG
ncbi:MAG TPA: FHA domain-containing protein [Steroidobacteraceae bacterium]|nr:FHA domain-containing protein [Steroidobacteraceae bacterium]